MYSIEKTGNRVSAGDCRAQHGMKGMYYNKVRRLAWKVDDVQLCEFFRYFLWTRARA